ncbi:hypothetical protein BASA83_001032 [Batrachochytrium salamandrivorans]|nr:hypothetical protein BASA83_001032 [Batrachochytrium salamandrivorans]
MRLFSFAALSFLAITVSAYPGPGTPPQGDVAQSAEQSQDADAPDPQHPQGADSHGLWQGLMDVVHDPQQFQNGVHNPQQPQDAGARDAEQPHASNGRVLQKPHERLLQDKLNKVGEEYNARKGVAKGIQDFITVLEKEIQRLGIRLGGLDDGPEYDGVLEKCLQLSEEVRKQYGHLKDMNQELKDLENMYIRKVDEILSS